LTIKTDSKSKEIWKVDNGGETRGVSLGGAITGFGAGTIESGYGGALIIDDPLKVEEANSRTYIEKCIRYYKDTLKSRLNNKNTPIILIMQRINKNDLVGYITKNEYPQWDFVTIPLIDDDFNIAWHEKYSLEAIKDMKDKNPNKFYSQYQQKPQDDETTCPFCKVEVVNYFGNDCIAWLDPSHKGRDYTAFCLIKRNYTNMVALGFMFKKSWDECVEDIAKISETFRVNTIIAETNGVGNIIIKILSELGARVQGYNTTIEKIKKIMALAVYRESIKLSNATSIYTKENKVFIDNCRDWSIESKECDDGIDSFASVMHYMGLTIKN
jgi:hypothetical protein